jgi:hypothetical protein
MRAADFFYLVKADPLKIMRCCRKRRISVRGKRLSDISIECPDDEYPLCS